MNCHTLQWEGTVQVYLEDKIVWQSRKRLNMEWPDEPGIHIQEKWKEYVNRKFW